jgi:hypothetical protein
MNARSQVNRGPDELTRIRMAYEKLRIHSIDPSSYAQGELGLALLRYRGLAAWIDAWRTYANPIANEAADRETADNFLSAGLQGEVVMVLASMVSHMASTEVIYGE